MLARDHAPRRIVDQFWPPVPTPSASPCWPCSAACCSTSRPGPVPFYPGADDAADAGGLPARHCLRTAWPSPPWSSTSRKARSACRYSPAHPRRVSASLHDESDRRLSRGLRGCGRGGRLGGRALARGPDDGPRHRRRDRHDLRPGRWLARDHGRRGEGGSTRRRALPARRRGQAGPGDGAGRGGDSAACGSPPPDGSALPRRLRPAAAIDEAARACPIDGWSPSRPRRSMAWAALRPTTRLSPTSTEPRGDRPTIR